MPSYRLVPVGDKLVLMVAPNERLQAVMISVANDCVRNETLNEVTASVGGASHE
jgi:hypothetical protein